MFIRVWQKNMQKHNLDGKKTLGYMNHRDSIQMLYNSDILLLIISKVEGAENFYSGKIFEYIRADREILAIVPEKRVLQRLF